MCGRYLLIDDEDVQRWVKTSDDASDFVKNEVFPSQKALVLVKKNQVMATSMHWGIEKWDNKGKIINARQETVATSLFFKEAFKTNRVIVLASGFYEWDQEKRKWLIRNQHHTLQYMAAIVIEGEREEFAILTQAAQPDFEFIHNRQPVFLSEAQSIDYLNYTLDEAWVLQPKSVSLDIEDVSIIQRLF